jgi:HK97 family phage prohead protease
MYESALDLVAKIRSSEYQSHRRVVAESRLEDVMELERRFLGECRVEADASRKIKGYAVVFNSLSQNLGGFREIITPEAVDRTLSEALDVRAMVDHDTGKVIGRTRSGTLELRKDKKGLRVVIDPAETTAGRDVLELVKRGDVSGMSFAFRVMPGGDEWREVDGDIIREVRDMTISEVSIVAFPAYTATDVSVAQRSLEEFRSAHTGSRLAWLTRVQKQRRARL